MKNITNRLLAMMLVGVILISNGYPVQAASSEEIELSVYGKSAIIMDMDTGEVLFSKKAKKKRENASTTKLLTAIVAVEKNKSLKKKMKISKQASNTPAVKIYMNRGDSYYFGDLLHALLISSANDSAVTIAERTSGSVDNFMAEVNKKAKELGCNNTHFANPNGLWTSRPHYTTAYDLALITKNAYANSTIRSIMAKKKYKFESLKGKKHVVKTTNMMLKKKKYYCLGKTGTGSVAKYCYAGVYTYAGRSYVIVTLGCKSDKQRWKDVKALVSACKQNTEIWLSEE